MRACCSFQACSINRVLTRLQIAGLWRGASPRFPGWGRAGGGQPRTFARFQGRAVASSASLVCGAAALAEHMALGDPHHAQCALGVLYNPSPHRTIIGAYHIEVSGKIVGETQTKALSAYHALFAATKRPRPRPSPAPQYAKHIGETVRVLTGPCTGHIGEITAVDGPSPIAFRVQFAAPVRCAEVGEVQAVWRQLDQLVFIDESV